MHPTAFIDNLFPHLLHRALYNSALFKIFCLHIVKQAIYYLIPNAIPLKMYTPISLSDYETNNCWEHHYTCNMHYAHLVYRYTYTVPWSHLQRYTHAQQYWTTIWTLHFTLRFFFVPVCCTSAHIIYLAIYLYDLCLKKYWSQQKRLSVRPK